MNSLPILDLPFFLFSSPKFAVQLQILLQPAILPYFLTFLSSFFFLFVSFAESIVLATGRVARGGSLEEERWWENEGRWKRVRERTED